MAIVNFINIFYDVSQESEFVMNLAEKLTHQVQDLPQNLQREVLDFVEFLKQKSNAALVSDDTHVWSDFSLASAMKGLEDDVDYSERDLKERW